MRISFSNPPNNGARKNSVSCQLGLGHHVMKSKKRDGVTLEIHVHETGTIRISLLIDV